MIISKFNKFRIIAVSAELAIVKDKDNSLKVYSILSKHFLYEEITEKIKR